MSGRRRLAAIGLVVVLAPLGVGAIILSWLFHVTMTEELGRLQEMAESRAGQVEAVARFDAFESTDYPGGAASATLSRIRDAQDVFPGFGRTGEFEFGSMRGDSVVFQTRDRQDANGSPPRVVKKTVDGLEPMLAALSGRTGQWSGRDHEGREVLAGYAPVPSLALGVVAKIEVSEVAEPFIQAAKYAGLSALAAVLLGLLALQRLGGRIVDDLEALEEGERETLERLTLVLRAGRVGILEVDTAANEVHLGAELARMLGEPPEDTVWRPPMFLERVHPDDRATMLRALDETQAGDTQVLDHAFRLRRADASYLSVVAAIQPVEGSGGGPVSRLVGTVADVTALEEARAGLLAREAHLRAAQAMGRVGSWEWRPSDGSLWWSDELYRLLGYEPGEVEPSGPALFDRLDPADLEEVTAKIERALEYGTHEEGEFTVVLPSGPRRMWGAARPTGHHGDAEGVIGLMQDVTETRELADMLRQSQKMETLGLLSGGVAHDFNNLLTAILANVDLLEARLADGPLGEDEPSMEEIRTAALLGADMVRRLMAFSRSNLPDRSLVDVAEMLRETSALIRRLLPRGIRVVTDVGHQALRCALESTTLQEILLNLATNARDAMEGRGTLSITSTVESGAQGRVVAIRVRDTGTGMTPEVLAKSFDPFFTTKGEGRGTGLGLAMVRALVEKQGGTVVAESVVDEGTTFTLRLPVVEFSEEDGGEPSGEAGVPVTGGGEYVLLVEDDSGVRRAAESILRHAGYRTTSVEDAEQALEVLSVRSDVDLIISDFTLPKMTGLDLYHRVRQEPPVPRFLLMSGYGEGSLAALDPEDPAVRFLRKPWGVDELLRAVRMLLDA